MGKRYMTLSDLTNFCRSQKMYSYSAEMHENVPIVVHEPCTFEMSEESSNGLTKTSIKACHIDRNRNNSSIAKEVMDKALPTFANRPILAHIVNFGEDGEDDYDFASHDFTVDEDGNVEYQEVPVGIVPESCNAHYEYDEEMDKTYVMVDGYLFDEYSRATEILKDKGETKMSVELSITDFAWNAKEGCLQINDFYFSGITALGRNQTTGNEAGEGMLGSKMTIGDFSSDENVEKQSQAFELLDKLKELLADSSFNIKGENQVDFEKGGNGNLKLKELLEKYSKTEEDLTFEVEGLSDEDLEAKFAEAFGEATPDGEDEGEKSEEESEDAGEDNTDEGSEESNDEDSSEEEPEPEAKEDEACGGKKKKKCSIENENGTTYTFEVSLQEQIYALQDLVNATYAEADNTYYGVTAYSDYLVMCDYWTGRYFKQSYTSENDAYSLTGDRVEVYATFVTADEQSALEDMRSNYEAISAELHSYKENEATAKKETILAEEAYTQYAEEAPFKELKEHIAEYSVEEFSEKAELAFAKCVKANGAFALHNVEKPEHKTIGYSLKTPKKADEPYGKLSLHYSSEE